MFKKNIVLSSLLSVALFGLAACGGGGSDDPAPTTPGTGGTTNPGTGGGTTNPGTGGGTTPTTPTTPTPVNLEFASGTYILEGNSSISEIVVSDNSLYLLAPNLGPTLARIDEVNTFVNDKTITNATGVAKIGGNGALKPETFSITFDDANNITTLSGLKYSAFNQGAAFTGVVNSTDLVALNGELAGTDFIAFAVDAGYNLTATDKYGCTIDGKLTAQSNDIFQAELIYSGASCVDSGSYEGTLWAYEHNSVTYLSWLAFNSDDTKLITGRLDTKPVSLATGVYTNADDSEILISKNDKIYYRNSNSGFAAPSIVFEYQPKSGTSVLASDNGYAISGTGADFQADLTLDIPSRDGIINGIIQYDNGSVQSIELKDFKPAKWVYDSVVGEWDELTINNGGFMSGKISGCDVLIGTAMGDLVASISATLDCSGTLLSVTGVAIAANASSTKQLFFNIHNSDFSRQGVGVIVVNK